MGVVRGEVKRRDILFEIYSSDKEAAKVKRVGLVEDDNGCIDLCIVDEYGGVDIYVLGLRQDGSVRLYSGVNSKEGLQVDAFGQVVVVDVDGDKMSVPLDEEDDDGHAPAPPKGQFWEIDEDFQDCLDENDHMRVRGDTDGNLFIAAHMNSERADIYLDLPGMKRLRDLLNTAIARS